MVSPNAKSRQFCSVCKEWLEMDVVPTSDGDDDDGVIWFRCPQCQGFLPKLRGKESEEEAAPVEAEAGPQDDAAGAGRQADSPIATENKEDDSLPWDSPADMMAALKEQEVTDTDDGEDAAEDEDPLLGVEEAEQAARPAAPGEATGSAATGGELPPDEDELIDAGDLPLPDLEEAGSLAGASVADDSERAEAAEEPSEPEEPLHEYAAMLTAMDPATAISYRPWGTYEVGQCIHHLAWDDCGVVVSKETLPGKRHIIKVYFEEAGVVRLIEQAER
jgi:hypothetical protein